MRKFPENILNFFVIYSCNHAMGVIYCSQVIFHWFLSGSCSDKS
ncbi:hypothetical protein D922_03344 [Enterococcus faecalis 06-MB-DW-09]|nr:hypothetical protein D931_03035 [Enterococcus faecium 13.SD.W.09]EPH89969.1 hypothetical protein D922_03344 [Enterococcus faecalis 06-MB-DW-09]